MIAGRSKLLLQRSSKVELVMTACIYSSGWLVSLRLPDANFFPYSHLIGNRKQNYRAITTLGVETAYKG